MQWFDYLLLVISLFLIMIIVLQTSKENASSAFSGEKSIAAHRSGLKTILIPKDNVKDLEEIPASVKNSLNIIPVETVDDVVNHAIIAKFTK